MKRFIINNSLSLTVAWFLVIFVLCATAGEFIPSSDWLDLLSIDKLIHAGMFFILTSLVFISEIRSGKTIVVFIISFMACVAYGCMLEWMQATFFRNRSMDWKDMVANTFGCMIAFLMIKKLRLKFVGEHRKLKLR